MKCIRCGQDSKYKERPNRTCPGCSKPFAFEPQLQDPFTDAAFQSAIDKVSSMGTVRFLPDHVRHELARRRRNRTARTGIWVFGAVATCFTLPFSVVAAGVVVAAFGAAGLLASPSATTRLDRTAFDVLWQRWLDTHGAPSTLIVRRPRQGPYRGHVEHDELQHYSFDRAVICDRAETVDVLLANNFHFENNCAVLSIDGYPEHAFEPVRAMLRKNPRLTVYALHDATVEGCVLAHRLATDPSWFRGGARVVEVGLRPAHARKLRGMWRDATTPVPDHAPLAAHERVWLRRYELELAAIRPEQVIKRLFAAVVSKTERKPASTYVDGGVYVGGDSGGGTTTDDYYVDDHAMSQEAEAADGGDDAFG